MDFKLTKTQMLQQELFRKFAETEIKPIAKDMDEAEDYDRELLQKLQKIGAFGIPYSREYGGQGADVRHTHCAWKKCPKLMLPQVSHCPYTHLFAALVSMNSVQKNGNRNI